MSTLVGSVSVRQLEHAGITVHDVRNCCQIQFGNELAFRHNTLTEEVQFYTECPERVFNRPDTVPVLQLHGDRGTYIVALMPPFDPTLHDYMTATAPETKVVPTRSKKLLLI